MLESRTGAGLLEKAVDGYVKRVNGPSKTALESKIRLVDESLIW